MRLPSRLFRSRLKDSRARVGVVLAGWAADTGSLFGPKAPRGRWARVMGPWGAAAARTGPGRAQPTHSRAHGRIIPYKDLNSRGRPLPAAPRPRPRPLFAALLLVGGGGPELPGAGCSGAPTSLGSSVLRSQWAAGGRRRQASSPASPLPDPSPGGHWLAPRTRASVIPGHFTASAGQLGEHYPRAQSCPLCTVRPSE